MEKSNLAARMSSGYEKNIEFIERNESFLNTNPTESQQEKASVWIFNKVVRNTDRNKVYTTVEGIKNDKDYGELKKIFGGDIPYDWLQSYLKQQEKLFNRYASTEWDVFEYKGSGTFRNFIEDKVKSLGIGKIADWSPADIWLVKNKQEVEDEINQHIGKDGNTSGQTIEQLNDILRKLFKEKRVVGVSLKKVSGSKAIFEEVNVRIGNERVLRRAKKQYTTSKSDIKIKLDLSLKNKRGQIQPATQDLTVKLGNKYRFQIKSTSGRYDNFDNLKFEGTPISASSARGGKAQVDKVVELLESNGLNFNNNNKDYPKNLGDFKKSEEKYVLMFEKIKNSCTTNIQTKTDFILTFDNLFSSTKQNIILANNKLMQLDFIYQVLQIKPNQKYEEFWTDMFWLSIRKGPKFGPFGKLY
jgi:hypothetical protein